MTPTMYLPIVQRTMEDEEAATVPVIPDELLALDLTQESPTQVQGLTGSWSRAGADLSWEAVAGEIEGYRIYRAVGSNEYSLLADLAADSTTFFDDGAGCGCAYFVTAFSAGGESLPSTSSYATPPCGW